jgi:DNA-directed RNA polymerase specialized sigma24 family protein
MNEVTGIPSAIAQGDPGAPGQLLSLVYDGLRYLAAQKLAREKPGHTLDATALVQEALEKFALHDPIKAKLVELRFFGGLTLEEAAACLEVSLSTADRA